MNLLSLVLLTLGTILCLVIPVLRQKPQLSKAHFHGLVFILVFVIPLTSLGFYLWLGSPDIPDQPLAQRRQAPNLTQEQKQVLEAKIKDLSQAIKDDNQNGLLWFQLGETLELLGRFDDASQAFARAYWIDQKVREQN